MLIVEYKRKRKKNCTIGCFVMILFLGFVLCLYDPSLIGYNALPNDRVMIENFHTHQIDFEELVRHYREYTGNRFPLGGPFWYEQYNIQRLFERIGVGEVTYAGGMPWLPNPYSIETALKVDSIIRYHTMRDFELWYKYGAIRIIPIGGYGRRYISSLRFGIMSKIYYFIPEVPHIENNILYGPVQLKSKGGVKNVTVWQSKERIFDSLDSFPKEWKAGECVMRQIEDHWFLRMCRGR